ncbi:probable secreted protein-putative xanthan lyase related [hydrothermal vent metagenome]|uniref:Probable secreted protein-putative xanthan lyase related n=1 Tax=hydrothermal vent metagenome TaxID=652676 RepID=A0A3B1E5X1_9ZZZZ
MPGSLDYSESQNFLYQKINMILTDTIMMNLKRFYLLMTFVLASQIMAITPLFAASSQPEQYDVVIYGGTSAGITAAIQVKKMNKTVLLIEPTKYIGGLTTGGLGFTDTGRKNSISGLSREFYQRMKKHYEKPSAWTFGKPKDVPKRTNGMGYDAQSDVMWIFEPHVAMKIFQQMLEEANVKVLTNERLNRKTGVKMKQGKIVSIAMESGKVFSGKMFIDTTYEGDLMAAAGVSYFVGRESNDKYNEHVNGVQKGQQWHKVIHHNLDPYITPGNPQSGLIYGLSPPVKAKDGTEDHRFQAYCYRMCLTNNPKNRVPFAKPKGYQEKYYELLFRNFEAGDMHLPLGSMPMPNHKTDTNNNGVMSTDNIGMNYKYPDASYAEREKIINQHKIYQQGLCWTLANHPRVPKQVRKRAQQWGLSKDEFVDNGHWPHQLYIREARRMISDYVVNENDCYRQRIAKDSIGLGSYSLDSHVCRRYVGKKGFVESEGGFYTQAIGEYAISYRAIVPKKEECKNLFVPVCLSSSHVAYGSFRMEPAFMMISQSAATAAVLAIENQLDVQDLPYQLLRKHLLKNKQKIDIPKSLLSKSKQVLFLNQVKGIVVDDIDATYTGNWALGTGSYRFIHRGYHYDAKLGEKFNRDKTKENRTATFETKLPHAGRYEVRMAYPVIHKYAAPAVPVTIYHAKGQKKLVINQQLDKTDNQGFISLGTFSFNKDGAKVVLYNRGTKNRVVVDAIQWLPVK